MDPELLDRLFYCPRGCSSDRLRYYGENFFGAPWFYCEECESSWCLFMVRGRASEAVPALKPVDFDAIQTFLTEHQGA